jgi:hypothetical protein
MFDFKDLYVSLKDSAFGHHVFLGCTNTGCGGTHGKIAIPVRWVQGNEPVDPGLIGVVVPFGASRSLKDSLRLALEAEEARETTAQHDPTSQDVAEIELLEVKLNEALKELKTRKAELQNKAA